MINWSERSNSNKSFAIHQQLMAAEIIKEYSLYSNKPLKNKNLAEILDVDRSTISRIVKGETIPSKKNTRAMIEYAATEGLLQQLIMNSINVMVIKSSVVVDTTGLLSNTRLLRLIAFLSVIIHYSDKKITNILTSEVDGLPIAYAFGFELNVSCVYARKEKPVAVEHHISAAIKSTSSRQAMFYVPTKAFTTESKILVVDDVIRSGKTQRAMLDIVEASNASVVGLLSLIGIDKRENNLLSDFKEKIRILHEI
jgi:purine operon repressor